MGRSVAITSKDEGTSEKPIVLEPDKITFDNITYHTRRLSGDDEIKTRHHWPYDHSHATHCAALHCTALVANTFVSVLAETALDCSAKQRPNKIVKRLKRQLHTAKKDYYTCTSDPSDSFFPFQQQERANSA